MILCTIGDPLIFHTIEEKNLKFEKKFPNFLKKVPNFFKKSIKKSLLFTICITFVSNQKFKF
jgi:hypothetical protein